MKSRLGSVRAASGLDRVNRAVQLLEDEWQQHGEVELEPFWTRERLPGADHSVDDIELLAELVKADLRCRFARGQTPAAADYLELFPQLRAENSRVVSLVYEEYCLAEERGIAPNVESFCDRYADWKSSLVSQLQYHRLLSQAAGGRPALPRFPETGQQFEEFRLDSLLGEGGVSRVFLASDLSLGGKQVVLKVTLDKGQEPKVQGPLDHPHIVPVNSVVYQKKSNLCGLSMPYRPGLPLDDVIKRVKPAECPRKAITLWKAIATDADKPDVRGPKQTVAHADRQLAGPRGDGWEGFPVDGSYAQGVGSIVMVLARALHYAHGMRTYHRDVKPGNLLLTLKSGPQLLDFNLADSPHSAQHAHAALRGGTVPYMAPEQIEAFINPDCWNQVGARADVYSLGLVMRELLTGQAPDLPDRTFALARALQAVLDRRKYIDVAVTQCNPAIPRALEAIVAKCLTLSPDDRYADAAQLEQDLDCFLRHLPLRHASNPSRRERVGNWLTRRRKFFATAAGVIATAALLCGIWLSRPLNGLTIVPEKVSKAVQDALHMIEEGRPDKAAARLPSLEQDDHSCLIKYYLAFAWTNDPKKDEEADMRMDEALVASSSESILKARAKDHPDVAQKLVRFAETRIQRADVLANGLDTAGSRVSDARRDLAFRNPTYARAKRALLLAEKLDREDWLMRRLLAKCELISGKYASAHDRLSRLLQSTNSVAVSPHEFFCRHLRGRVAFLWAEHDRRESGVVDQQTEDRLREAVKDLDLCTEMFKKLSFKEDPREKQYRVIHDQLRAIVTLAEVEMDRKSAEAKKHFELARAMVDPLIRFIDANRLAFPKPTDLADRVKEGLSHLRGDSLAEESASTRSIQRGF